MEHRIRPSGDKSERRAERAGHRWRCPAVVAGDAGSGVVPQRAWAGSFPGEQGPEGPVSLSRELDRDCEASQALLVRVRCV